MINISGKIKNQLSNFHNIIISVMTSVTRPLNLTIIDTFSIINTCKNTANNYVSLIYHNLLFYKLSVFERTLYSDRLGQTMCTIS